PSVPARQPAPATGYTPPAGATRSPESRVSPLEADRARKGRSYDPEMSAAAAAPHLQSQAVGIVDAEDAADARGILDRVIAAREEAGHSSPAMILEKGSVRIEGGELVVTVAAKPVVINLAFPAEPMRVAQGAASRALGRAVKLKIISGAEGNGN